MFLKEEHLSRQIQTNCHRFKSAVDQINYVLMVYLSL